MKQYKTPFAVVMPVKKEDILCLNGSVPTALGENETPGAIIFS